MYTGQPSRNQNRDFEGSSKLVETARNYGGFATETKGPSGNKVYILLLAPRPAGKARATSIPGAVCKERATAPAGLRAAARRGAAAGGHLLCCRSSTMHSGIACVAAPRICPPGARAKMHTLFPDGPLVHDF